MHNSSFNAKKITSLALLTALAIALSLAERVLPLGELLGIPWFKLGLSNIAVLYALVKINLPSALIIVFLKSFIVAFFTSMSTLLFSLLGGLLAVLVMFLLIRKPNFFSLIGVSVSGAVAHNIGQCFIAYLTLGDVIIFTYLPILLIAGLISGVITGIIVNIVLPVLYKN